jgi:hypothetical protein
MKLKSIILCALALTGAAACTKVNVTEAPEYVAPLYIQASDSKVVFDVVGGQAMITLATNGTVACGEVPAGFELVEEEDATYIVKAGVNTSAATVSADLTFTATRDEESVSTTVSLVQRAAEAQNLSAAGLANCYIAHTNGTFRFNAQVKGNGKGDGGCDYIKNYGVNIEGGSIAALLWEARHDGDRSLSYEVIDGTPVYHNGYITFSTGRSQGNAVIAIEDIHGEVLWSWHIWVTDTPVTSHDHILPDLEGTPQVVAQIMDRNLGAMNNEPMNLENRGMFYQWGRKDPFLPSRTPYRTNGYPDINEPEDNEINNEIGDGTRPWDVFASNTAPKTSVNPGNVPYSIKYPTKHIEQFSTNSLYTWYVSSVDSKNKSVVNVKLWDETKTIFDPCPAGYKVPGGKLYANFANVDINNPRDLTGGKPEEYTEDFHWLWEKFENCGRVWKATGDFYPVCGTFVPMRGEDYVYNHYTGEMGMYWTTSPNEYQEGESTYYEYEWIRMNEAAALSGYGAMVYACQIRCVKE